MLHLFCPLPSRYLLLLPEAVSDVTNDCHCILLQLELVELDGKRCLRVASSQLQHTCTPEANIYGHRRLGLSKAGALQTRIPALVASGLRAGSKGSVGVSLIAERSGLRASEQVVRDAQRAVRAEETGNAYDFRCASVTNAFMDGITLVGCGLVHHTTAALLCPMIGARGFCCRRLVAYQTQFNKADKDNYMEVNTTRDPTTCQEAYLGFSLVMGSGFRAIRSGLLFCVICTDATNVGREVSVPAQVRESPLCPHWRSACCSDSCVSCVNRCAWLAVWCSAWCVQQSRSCPSRIGEAAGHGWRRWFAEARITCAQPLPRRVDTGLQAALRVRKKGTENHACWSSARYEPPSSLLASRYLLLHWPYSDSGSRSSFDLPCKPRCGIRLNLSPKSMTTPLDFCTSCRTTLLRLRVP